MILLHNLQVSNRNMDQPHGRNGWGVNLSNFAKKSSRGYLNHIFSNYCTFERRYSVLERSNHLRGPLCPSYLKSDWNDSYSNNTCIADDFMNLYLAVLLTVITQISPDSKFHGIQIGSPVRFRSAWCYFISSRPCTYFHGTSLSKFHRLKVVKFEDSLWSSISSRRRVIQPKIENAILCAHEKVFNSVPKTRVERSSTITWVWLYTPLQIPSISLV